MSKLIEIEGKLVQVLTKTIEINGKNVTTQGDIRIFFDLNAPIDQVEGYQTSASSKQTSDVMG